MAALEDKSSDGCTDLWVLRYCSSDLEGLRGLLEIYGDRRNYNNRTTVVAGHLLTVFCEDATYGFCLEEGKWLSNVGRYVALMYN